MFSGPYVWEILMILWSSVKLANPLMVVLQRRLANLITSTALPGLPICIAYGR